MINIRNGYPDRIDFYTPIRKDTITIAEDYHF